MERRELLIRMGGLLLVLPAEAGTAKANANAGIKKILVNHFPDRDIRVSFGPDAKLSD